MAQVLLAIFAAAPTCALAGAPISFNPGSYTQEYASDLALADFDRDGKLDLFTASCPVVKLRLGDGTGAFGAPVSSATPDTGQCHLAVGDLNGDGIPDAAVVFGFVPPSSPGRVAVFFSDGAGGLVDGPVLSVASYPNSVALGDFNTDGIADLVVGSALSNPLTVVLGTGGGAFAEGTSWPSGGRPATVAVGDFNLDGKQDVAAPVSDATVAILLGNGDATFGAPSQFPAGPYPFEIAATDVDGDGKLDIVVTNDGSDSVSVLYGNGLGGFAAAVAVVVGSYPRGLTVRDLNGDGSPDLIVTTTSNGYIGSNDAYIVRNLGNRTFDGPVLLLNTGLPGDHPVDAGDLNGDGRPDLAVHENLSSSYVRTFLNSTQFPARRHDLDGDLHSDILWRNVSSGEDYIFLMNGVALAAGSNYTNAVPDLNWQFAGSGDFDGDGRVDLLWRKVGTGEDYIFLMNGTAVKAGSGYINTVGAPWTVAGVGDFDGDGKADILWRNGVTGEDYIFFMDGITVNAGSNYTNAVPDQSWQVAGVADFDGDGRADILWRNSGSGESYVFLMDGIALKIGSGYTNTVGAPWAVAGTGDYDGDGKADILWRNATTGEDYVFLMNATTVQAGSGYTNSVPLDWQIVGTGDYDGDGRADILWRHATSGDNYVFLMNGTTVQPGSNFTNSVPDLTWQVVNR